MHMLTDAASDYQYYGLAAELNQDEQEKFLKLVVEGVLLMEICLPLQPWFHPAVFIAWFLEDECVASSVESQCFAYKGIGSLPSVRTLDSKASLSRASS